MKMLFETGHVDTEARHIVAYRPKDQSMRGLREETGLSVTEGYDGRFYSGALPMNSGGDR